MCIESFFNLVKTQFNAYIKIVRSNNRVEFKMVDFFNHKYIVNQRLCVETPQQNGVVERKYQHLLNVAQALLFQSHLPSVFWNDCVLTTIYLINRTPTPVLNNKTPFEVPFAAKPHYSHLKVFGCLCFASTLSHRRKKFDPRGMKCAFLGYPFRVKRYKLLDFESNTTFI